MATPIVYETGEAPSAVHRVFQGSFAQQEVFPWPLSLPITMEIDQDCGLTVCQRRPMELSPRRERPPKMPRTDFIALAQQINEADSFVHANLCNKLKPIADQMKFLRQQAFQVLETAQRDNRLHHIQCSFKKVPGQIYHLYEKLSGEQYMSMLSPDLVRARVKSVVNIERQPRRYFIWEWAVTTGPAQTHLGSFRLEADQSWTPAEDVTARDSEMLAFRQFMQREDALPALMGNKQLF